MNSHKIKRWAVNVLSEGQTPIALFCDGRPLTQSVPATIDDVSPVQYLLLALASCLAVSCRAVLVDMKRPRVSFEVVATSEKLPSAANRLANISIVVIFRGGISDADAALITAQAKPMCTVTNTVTESPNIQYRSRAFR